MELPWIFSFWFMVAAYVVHVLDESLLGGSFVEKVQEHWWPEYSWRQFFWFNAGYFGIMIASVVCYDFFGGAWVILPLAWSIERALNGAWHLWWTVHFHEYSPGLVSSILMWINFYFLLRYRPEAQPLTAGVVAPAVVIGLGAAIFLFSYIPLVKGGKMHRVSH
jgi:hypothetical protein